MRGWQMGERRPLGEKEYSPLEDSLDLINKVLANSGSEAEPRAGVRLVEARDSGLVKDKDRGDEHGIKREASKPKNRLRQGQQEELMTFKFRISRSDYKQAKNIVAAGIAKKCEVQLSYAIGVAEPVSIKVDTYGTSNVSEEKIAEAVKKIFDLTPKGIEKALELRERKFKYQDLAAFGHIGRTDIDLPWERLNKTEELKKVLL